MEWVLRDNKRKCNEIDVSQLLHRLFEQYNSFGEVDKNGSMRIVGKSWLSRFARFDGDVCPNERISRIQGLGSIEHRILTQKIYNMSSVGHLWTIVLSLTSFVTVESVKTGHLLKIIKNPKKS